MHNCNTDLKESQSRVVASKESEFNHLEALENFGFNLHVQCEGTHKTNDIGNEEGVSTFV